MLYIGVTWVKGWGNIGITEEKMEATIVFWGYIGNMALGIL